MKSDNIIGMRDIGRCASRAGGFSLIELSFVIAVAAAAAMAFLSWTEPKFIAMSDKQVETKYKMERIAKAILDFRIEKGRLPCPADPRKRSDGTYAAGFTDTYVNDYGLEDLDVNQSDGTLGIDCPRYYGSVPVFSLNLDESYMYDLWGNRFTYAVATSLCSSDKGTTLISTDESRARGCSSRDYIHGVTGSSTGNITISSMASAPAISRFNTNQAAYVVVSHGENGFGAYTASGSVIPRDATYTTASDDENSDLDMRFMTQTFFYPPYNTVTDDILLFKTKTQLDSNSKDSLYKLISGTDCQAISNTISTITAAIAKNNLNVAIDNYQITGVDGKIYNKGENVALDLLWTAQTLCATYYGTTGSLSNSTWTGVRCPGGGVYQGTGGGGSALSNNYCQCTDRTWDGSC